MLVFGDHSRTRDPRIVIDELRTMLAAPVPPGLARHEALVRIFIEASELAQGLADASFARLGRDARAPVTDTAMELLVELARAIAASWPHGHATHHASVERLAACALPESIRMRRAEGYAFYAVYPEAYVAAAVGSDARHAIGIRSIGAGLAAIVTAVTGAKLPVTVRPHGDPHRRQVAVDPALLTEWGDGGTIAICDEGPGISGSSFGAVADLLEDHGVARARLECFPSHHGDLGPAASERHRRRWGQVRRRVIEADALLLPTGILARWIEALVGPLSSPLEDLSAGAWRNLKYAHEADWPPSIRYQERLKYLARAGGTAWLARFVGLGRDGEHALARARELATAGFTPQVAGLCHGFLVERWYEDACCARPSLEVVGRYLGYRARSFAAPQGAGHAALAAMATHNARLALGEHVELVVPPPGHAVEIDGRMHRWEWLERPDGTTIKADALDHHAGHDLVGCQDIAWDLAGAAIELDLTDDEQRLLAAIVRDVSGRAVDPDLLAFFRPCYLAFQLGRHTLAIGTEPSEAARLRALVDRYAYALRVTVSADRR
ncbi:MAG: hypothetical protein JWO36_1979 [Myxococcales bacterium]|nr:hypothetical protein [Myxococcales bacterium]